MAGDYFKGYISTVRMYNRALSETELRKLAREWKKPVPDAPIGTGGILISSSNTISAGKFHKNESAEIPSSGLLLHASLEQDSETAETGQTFTKSGNVTFETVQGMKCAHFDGNSYWQVPFESELAGNTAKAVSLWMWGTKNITENIQTWAFGVGYWSSTQAFGVGQATSSSYSNRIYATMYGGDCSPESPLATSDFHHIVFQYNLSKTELFVDGVKLKEVNYSSANTNSSYPITIGWNGMSLTYNKRFTGYISGVRVYNRALSEMEIQNLSNEWQRTGRTNKIFIPVMDKIETEPTMFEKIVAAVNENAGIEYTATVSEFGDFSDSSKWNSGVLAPNGKIYGIPYSSTTVLEIDPTTNTSFTFGSLSGSSDKWNGGVLAPNGKIYAIPRESETVLEINPVTRIVKTFGHVEKPSSGIAYIGGVLAPNGKIYAIPYNAGTILKIDPASQSVSTFGTLSGLEKWSGGVLAPNGKIYGIPYGSSSVLEIDPETDSISTFGSLSGSSKWDGGVLAPNGKIYGIPRTSSSVLEIDPLTGTVSTFGNISSNGAKWSGGVLAPNGKIYGIPRDSRMILEIDPETRTVSTFQTLSSSGNKWRGGTLAPNGKIYAIPFNASTILEISFDWSGQPFTTEICLSSCLNKF